MENTDKVGAAEELSFEAALARLEKIVEAMEGERLPLDDMMRNFEEGKRLYDLCGRKLSELERKIEVLVDEAPEGGAWKDFDDASGRRGADLPPRN